MLSDNGGGEWVDSLILRVDLAFLSIFQASLSFCRHTSVKSKKVMASRIIQDYT